MTNEKTKYMDNLAKFVIGEEMKLKRTKGEKVKTKELGVGHLSDEAKGTSVKEGKRDYASGTISKADKEDEAEHAKRTKRADKLQQRKERRQAKREPVVEDSPETPEEAKERRTKEYKEKHSGKKYPTSEGLALSPRIYANLLTAFDSILDELAEADDSFNLNQLDELGPIIVGMAATRAKKDGNIKNWRKYT